MTRDDGREPDGGGREQPQGSLAERMTKAREATARTRVERALRRAPRATVIRVVVGVVLVLMILYTVLHTASSSSAHDEQARENVSTIAELEKELAQAKVAATNVPDAAALSPAFDDAASKATAVADLQNQMAGLNFDVKDASKALASYGSLTDQMKQYLSIGSMSGGSFLPQGQWYQPQEQGRNHDGDPAWVRLPAGSWNWKSIPTKTADANGNVSVIWTAQLTGGSQDGALLAWVLASYDPRRAAFYDFSRGLTPEGYKRLGATRSSGAGFDSSSSPSTSLAPAPDPDKLLSQSRESNQGQTTTTTTAPATPGATPTTTGPAPAPATTPPAGNGGGDGVADPGLGGN